MLGAHSRPNLLLISASVLLLLLSLAGVLIYRWIDRASEADRQQQKEFLETAMRSFEGEFSGTFQDILSTFRPASRLQTDTPVESYIAGLYSHWRSTAKQPQLIGTVSIGTAKPDGSVTFLRLLPQDGQFQEQTWPASLEVFRHVLQQRSPARGDPLPFPPAEFALMLSEDRPVMVLPLLTIPSPGMRPLTGMRPLSGSHQPPLSPFLPGLFLSLRPPHEQDPPPAPGSQPFMRRLRHPDSRGERLHSRLTGWCFLELDPAFLQNHFLPGLVERHFDGAGLSKYQLAVVTGQPWRFLYKSHPALTPEMLSSVDAAVTLFSPGVRFSRGARGIKAEKGFGHGAREITVEMNSDGETWRLLAKHEAGSIEAVANAARRRNLGIGFGLLLILGVSMVLLMVTTQRARALAKQQMEFVAGVTHELRTPLAVIHSAGFNLARGVVGEAGRVQHYGNVIQTESRRLSDMVEQILSFAGIQSGRKRYEFQPTRISDIIEAALAEYAATFHETGWQVEKEIAPNLPLVLADAPALESAMKNLLQNALKYASDGQWLRLSARAEPNRKTAEVLVTVEDRGPGIDPGDLSHIFDPFYRGQHVVASSIPGAGLGLSLVRRHVQAHRGRVTVKTSPGQGAAFTLHLPALARAEEGETV